MEIPCIVMKTNDLTCVTFTDFAGNKNHISSTEAYVYNAAPGTLKIYGQRNKNSWRVDLDPAYSLKHIAEDM